MTYKPAADIHKDALKSRAVKTLSKKPRASPSERSSTLLKKKLSRGVEVAEHLQQDCRDCHDYPTCTYNHKLNTCYQPSRRERCMQCGLKVEYRFVFGEPYYCPSCKELRNKWHLLMCVPIWAATRRSRMRSGLSRISTARNTGTDTRYPKASSRYDGRIICWGWNNITLFSKPLIPQTTYTYVW